MDGYLNWLSAQLFAEVSGMNADNQQRAVLGESMAYVDSDYYNVLKQYRDMYDVYVQQLRDKG